MTPWEARAQLPWGLRSPHPSPLLPRTSFSSSAAESGFWRVEIVFSLGGWGGKREDWEAGRPHSVLPLP